MFLSLQSIYLFVLAQSNFISGLLDFEEAILWCDLCICTFFNPTRNTKLELQKRWHIISCVF